MGQNLVINLQWWQIFLGCMVGGFTLLMGFERLAKRLLKPWLQENVGAMMDAGLARERVHSAAAIAALELKFTACQTNHHTQFSNQEKLIERIEAAIQGEIKEVKGKLDDVVEQLTGVREHLARLTGEVRQNGKAAL